MPLLSLPFDILLPVLRDLDIIDVVRAGMTCKDLHEATQDRHVWTDQLEKLRQQDPMLRSATPPLASLSAQELKTFVTRRTRLRLRWDKDAKEDDFAAMGLVEFHGVEDLRLLPGGKSMLVISNFEGATLCRIEMHEDRVSLPVVAKLPRNRSAPQQWQLLTAMSPCPILAQREEDVIHLVRVDHHNGTMNLETTFTIPEEYGFIEAHGQGRVVGFLIKSPSNSQESPQAIIINLDYPGVSVKCKVPIIYDPGFYPSTICIPTASILVVYNMQHILAYDIPDFSSLSPGTNPSGVMPAWHWPVTDQDGIDRFISPHMTGEALYDPRSAQGFDLHYYGLQKSADELSVTTIAVPINLKDSFVAFGSTKSPPLKQRSSSLSHGDTRRPIWFSCQGALHFSVFLGEDPRLLEVLVTPLNDHGLEGGRGTLRMIVSFAELECCTRAIKADMDEATGRVVIWGWDRNTHQRKIFVGDLV